MTTLRYCTAPPLEDDGTVIAKALIPGELLTWINAPKGDLLLEL
jgi:hypothetical protein